MFTAPFPAISRAAELPAGEVPLIGKIAALSWLYRLNAASIVRLQHDAGAIGRINERKSPSVALQVAEFIDECYLIHVQVGCYGRDILIGKAHITLPAAACATPLAGMLEGRAFRGLAHISQGLRAAAVMCGGRT